MLLVVKLVQDSYESTQAWMPCFVHYPIKKLTFWICLFLLHQNRMHWPFFQQIPQVVQGLQVHAAQLGFQLSNSKGKDSEHNPQILMKILRFLFSCFSSIEKLRRSLTLKILVLKWLSYSLIPSLLCGHCFLMKPQRMAAKKTTYCQLKVYK